MSLVWRWLLLAVALAATTALPVPDEVTDTSTKVLGSSVVTSVSVVMGHEDGNGEKNTEKSDTRKVTDDLPASTVDMMKPDGFQFYTVDDKGQLITRQMTDAEIQSIIAAGGGPFPIETQESEKNGENLTGEMKVADVVENVQKVLKGELSKPATAIGTVPTIPGHANDEWSSILPSILGGDTESAPVTLPVIDAPVQETKQNVSAMENPEVAHETSPEKPAAPETPETKPQGIESTVKPAIEQAAEDESLKPDHDLKREPPSTDLIPPKKPQETPAERPMIPVPVITADSVQPTTKDPSPTETKPVYQILNTISAEEAKDKVTQTTQGTSIAVQEADKKDSVPVPVKEPSSEISSSTEKTESASKEPEVVVITEKESAVSSTATIPVTKETENELSPTAATLQTIIDANVTSSFVPEVQEGSDKSTTSSGSKDTEEVTPEVEAASDLQKIERPSIVLEAPVVQEKPVELVKSEENLAQVIPELKPATENDKGDEKLTSANDQAPAVPLQQSETTTLAATIEQEVSESISSIVEELTSEIADEMKDGATSEDSKVSVIAPAEKLSETSITEDSTKLGDSKDKTGDTGASVSEESVISDDKKVPAETLASKLPEIEVEPVFERLPEISPDTKIVAGVPAASGNVEDKPEVTEAGTEPAKIVPEETIPVDKIEQQSNTNAESEAAQNLVPVIGVATSLPTKPDSVSDKYDETTQTATEKKPETLPTELADSVSSMISQVSEVRPSMVPIPQKSESNDQLSKRVEDVVKAEEASTVKTEVLVTTATIATEAPILKPLVSDVESPPKIVADDKEEVIKPAKNEPEVIMVEIKAPEPETTSSNPEKSETTKTSEPVATELPESSTTTENEKLDSTKIETSFETAILNDKNTEQTKVSSADSESTTSTESTSDEKPVKSEQAVASRPEETKSEVGVDKIEAVVEDGTRTETPVSEAEAPIVRIDITEAKPTDSDIKNDDSTESSVVRIQLTDPVSMVNQMIDSAPVRDSPVEVEDILFPEKNVLQGLSAQNAGSSLIAGVQPANITEIKTPEDISQPETAVPSVNQILKDASPTETTNIDSDMKTTSSVGLKTDTESSGDEKLQLTTENTRIFEVEVTQATIEAKPEATDEPNTKLPTPDVEASKTSVESDETKAKKPAETLDTNTVASDEDSVKPVRIDLPIPAVNKVESPVKDEIPDKTTQATDKIIEPVTVVFEEKVERTPIEEPVKEAVEVPKVEEISVAVPPEVVVSTIIDVQPTKGAINPEENAELVVKENTEKPEEIFSTTKIEPESSGYTEKIENTATKITDTPIESTENLVPVELAIPTPPQPDLQPPDYIQQVSTSAPASEHKVAEKIDAESEIRVPVTDAAIKNDESTEKHNELPAAVEISDALQREKEPVAEQEIVKTEGAESQSSGDEPAKKIPSVTKPAVSDPAAKDQTSVPLVRIDISPEKNQSEISTKIDSSLAVVKETEKMEKKPESTNADNKKPDNSETPELTETNLAEVDKSVEKTGVPKNDSAIKSSGVQLAVKKTTSSLESSSKAPAEAVNLIPETDKVQSPPVTEMAVETTVGSVQETVNTVHSKLPEVTVPVETTSPAATKIESGEEIAKPVVRIETVSNTASNNGPVKTQEIRIQVNDTAVLVTKQQIPEKVAENDKKVKPTESSESLINKIEVTSEPIEPTKVPELQNLAPVTDSHQTDKTTVQNSDKVKAESTSEQKKPAVDPYAKLGEKESERKPVAADPPKTQILGNKKTTNTESNKDAEDKWTLILQNEPYPTIKQQAKPSEIVPALININDPASPEVSVPLEAHQSAVNLEESTRDLDKDIGLFSKLCNELAFSFWISANKGLSTARSLALSPFGMTSMLAMVFLGARGPTSGQMNDILKLDDVVTFNPHLVFQNVSDSVNLARGQGIANAAFVRELFADRIKAGRLLPFYKERAQQFYDGHVEEVNFATISDLVRRRTNLLIRRQTGGRIRDFVKGNVMPLRSPLAALSANVFQTDCTGASSEGRDGEMYFAVLPAVRQRKLVPVPATVWRSGVLAGYEPRLDATVVSLGGIGNLVSTIFVLPGQQGLAAPGDSLDHLERRLLEGAFTDGAWDRLLKVLIPRMGLEIQVPKFSHRSVVNATAALKRMGLDELFSKHADLKGINGIGNDLHLADMLQINLFSTCGDEVITGGRHHIEIYPASPLRGARGDGKTNDVDNGEIEEPKLTETEDNSRSRRSLKVEEYVQESQNFGKRSTSLSSEKQLIPDDKQEEERSQRSSISMKVALQGSKGKQNDRPLLKLDRPFLYFVRHNPTGMILHMGRFNPRLMP